MIAKAKKTYPFDMLQAYSEFEVDFINLMQSNNFKYCPEFTNEHDYEMIVRMFVNPNKSLAERLILSNSMKYKT
jgi:hypothetical protein